MNAAVLLTTDQAEALRRCASEPDIDAGLWTEATGDLYEPLVRDGLLARTIRPWRANELYELVHYQTTEHGKWALAIYDRQKAREAHP
jgi:hypothetical protein